MATQKNAYVDVNPVIVTSDCKIVLAKRTQGIVGGGMWHLPGGRVQFKEIIENTLKRVAFVKTNLKVEPFWPSLKESLVGIYDDPEGLSRSCCRYRVFVQDCEWRNQTRSKH